MSIRPATPEDIPALLEMGARFAELASLAEHVGYNSDNMRDTFGQMIEGEHYCIFISDSGAIGGVKAPHPFNYSHWMAQELFWWSEGKGGLGLLRAFEEWAGRTCHSVRMITLEAVEPERVGRIYEKQGYVPLEHGYIKVL